MKSFMELKNKFSKTYRIILIILALITFFVYVTHFFDKKPSTTEITVGTTTIYAQIANTEHKRSMGLSFTEKLGDNSGMVFIFDETGKKHFWMRDMYFDIDIIWLDESKHVLGFFENVSKDSYNKTKPELSKVYHSPENTKYVLEVNAGTIERLKIKTGDTLDFKY